MVINTRSFPYIFSELFFIDWVCRCSKLYRSYGHFLAYRKRKISGAPELFYRFDLIHFFPSSIICQFYKFDLILFLQVRLYIILTRSTLCILNKFDLISVFQVRPYALLTSSTLYQFYKFDIMPFLQVRPDAFFTSLTLCPF